jgi:hypothetical protein
MRERFAAGELPRICKFMSHLYPSPMARKGDLTMTAIDAKLLLGAIGVLSGVIATLFWQLKSAYERQIRAKDKEIKDLRNKLYSVLLKRRKSV